MLTLSKTAGTRARFGDGAPRAQRLAKLRVLPGRRLAGSFLTLAILACALETSAQSVFQRLPSAELQYSEKEAPTLESLASHFAPVLWFSPDEHLRHLGAPVPEVLPCDASAEDDEVFGPVVYYFAPPPDSGSLFSAPGLRLDRDRLDQAMDRTLDRQPLEIEFLFYYREDSGAGGHRNDLESVTLTFVIGRNPSDPSRYLAQLLEIEGAAHGSRFYANRLRIRESASGRILAPDVAYPLTLLVEENKHAVSPDRNGDGVYTPGYDVNRSVVDAWGVRDSFGAGWLGSLSYQAYMTKRRVPDDRVWPPTVHDPRPGEGASAALRRYTLRSLPPSCFDHVAVEASDHALEHTFKSCSLGSCRSMSLKGLLTSKGVLPKSPLARLVSSNRDITLSTVTGKSGRDYGVGQIWPLWTPLVGGTFGVEGRIMGLHTGWPQSARDAGEPEPRGQFSVLGLFTPSLTRAVDWYFAGGIGGRFVRERDPNPLVENTAIAIDVNPQVEVGLWFRWASRLSFRVGGNIDGHRDVQWLMSLSVDPAANRSR